MLLSPRRLLPCLALASLCQWAGCLYFYDAPPGASGPFLDSGSAPDSPRDGAASDLSSPPDLSPACPPEVVWDFSKSDPVTLGWSLGTTPLKAIQWVHKENRLSTQIDPAAPEGGEATATSQLITLFNEDGRVKSIIWAMDYECTKNASSSERKWFYTGAAELDLKCTGGQSADMLTQKVPEQKRIDSRLTMKVKRNLGASLPENLWVIYKVTVTPVCNP